MSKEWILSSVIIALCFCGSLKAQGTSSSEKDAELSASEIAAVKKGVADVFAAMTDRWNAHDLVGFLNYSWKSPHLVNVEDGVVQRGWDKILADYQKGFRQPSEMGSVYINVVNVEAIKPDIALAYIRTTIYLVNRRVIPSDSFETLKKFPNGWKIVGGQDASVAP
jgi:uncharacterized protein (TIGR02246 family)